LRRDYPCRPVVGVGAVILDDGKLVLVRRGVEPSLGKWSIPGGAVELGEPVRDATMRETKEECGLDVELIDDRPMDAFDNLIMDEAGHLRYHYVLLQFLVRPKGGSLKPTSDVTDAIWVPLENVENYDLTESFRLFFRKHRNELETCGSR
jgi:8-oxo-dGTP diphosphatase